MKRRAAATNDQRRSTPDEGVPVITTRITMMIRAYSGPSCSLFLSVISLGLLLLGLPLTTGFVAVSPVQRQPRSSSLFSPKNKNNKPFVYTKTTPTRSTNSHSPFLLRLRRAEIDLDVTFGSSNTSGLNWEDGEEGDPEYDYQLKRAEHSAKVEELLEIADQDFRQKRREKKWGAFANVTKKEDVQEVVSKEQLAILKENERKAKLASMAGVQYEVLEPREPSYYADDDGNVKVTLGSAKGWFDEMDQELADEWKELTGDSSNTAGELATAANHVHFAKTGKLLSRDALSGVRVGSTGGWSLEVFPGDFVVHRKFGIGRFDRTCLQPKTKLSAKEQEAMEKRRAGLLEEKLKELQAKKIPITPTEIQKVRSTFGTEEDKDIISNPQTTMLEISYTDGIVHVPVDRAYRLSRYRAGDAVKKPRLSRIRGGGWANDRRRVEETTLELAEDVLALYATRETLIRPPFDPSKEDEVKELEKTFAFEPTVDQKKCFEDVENDMVWRNRPMDRVRTRDMPLWLEVYLQATSYTHTRNSFSLSVLFS
jgi:transcription-repair coupling factor (superfamily II helicase)